MCLPIDCHPSSLSITIMRCLNCHDDRVLPTAEICPSCGVYLPALLKDVLTVETVLKESYQIQDVLGRGSYGITYQARHCVLNHSVAIKEFYPQDYATRNLLTKEVMIPHSQEHIYRRGLQRFLEEGQMLVSLQHPHVIKVQDLFEERNTAYLVMDLIDGQTLTSMLTAQSDRKLPPQQIEELMSQLVSALATVHAAGICHLDLKPDNLLLTPDRKLVLIDFGAAKRAASNALNQTRFFTESYAAPELISGGEVGPESDIFELGMLLYELLTGSLPPPAVTRLVEGEIWTCQTLPEPWQTRISSAIQLKRADRPNQVQQWWGNWGLTPRSSAQKVQMVASLRGSFVLGDLRVQEMQQRLGRGEIKKVFPLNHQLLVVCSAGGAALIDLLQDEILWEIDCPTDCATLSAPGGYLAIAWGQVIYIWSLVTGSLVQKLTGHEKPIGDLAFAPAQDRLASASEDGTIAIWEIATGQLIDKLTGSHWWVTTIAFSPDGRWLASGSRDPTIKLWDVSSGQLLRRFVSHTGSVERLIFSSDGQFLISGSRDRTVRVWDVRSGQLLRQLKGHMGWITDLAISSDNNLLASASGIDDKRILIWDLTTGESLGQLRGHWNSVRAIAFCRDSYHLVSASYDQTICLWDIASTLAIATVKHHTNWVYSIASSASGRWVISGNNDRTIHLWDTLQPRQVYQFVGHSDLVSSVAFSPDEKTIASGSWDRTLRLWEASSGKLLKVLQGHQGFVYCVAFSPDGRWLASGSSDRTIRLWEIIPEIWFLKRTKTTRILDGHLDDVRTLTFSPDSRLLISGSSDRTIRVWEVASGQEVDCLEGQDSKINGLAVSRDGTQLVSGGDEPSLYLWEIATGKLMGSWLAHQTKINSLAFSPDGQSFISGSSDRTVRQWDLRSGQLRQTWFGHTHSVNSVAFSQNGTFVISASQDGVIRLWRV